jgi:hypothetical protein
MVSQFDQGFGIGDTNVRRDASLLLDAPPLARMQGGMAGIQT